MVVATTRPETMLGDTGVAVNPGDERYKDLVGKTCILPLMDREIPIIADDYVEMEFGSGCVKMTPAHDPNDFEVGLRHNLEFIRVMDDDGKINELGGKYQGLDRYEARKVVVADLEALGLVEKIEPYERNVGTCYRCATDVEPIISAQWFVRMKPLAEEAIRVVSDGEVRFVPDRFSKIYTNWMENVHDWCISRQLWWGQRIPAWYLPSGDFVVEPDVESALKAARAIDSTIKPEDLKQDSDVLDTWFSSWLWPISVFDANKPGHPDATPNDDLAYYYPTNDLVTAPEILFFWVARMVMAGHEFCGDLPFRNVYLTGTVRDKQGRKMSKSLGNSPDPIKLMEVYGADGVRVGMLICSSAGTDILFDESQVEQGRNFANKIWNAYRLIKGWNIDENATQTPQAKVAVKWFDELLSSSIETIDDHFEKFRISDALMLIYKLFWDDFCAWYLELIKPQQGAGIDASTYNATITIFDKLLRILHPFMPFISEELWQNIGERNEGETIMLSSQPEAGKYNPDFLADFEVVKDCIVNIRGIRQSKGISPKEPLSLLYKGELGAEMISVIEKMANINSVGSISDKGADAKGVSFLTGSLEFFLPLEEHVDVEEELRKIEEEIKYYRGFLENVMKKLSNEKFVSSAPKAVVDMELKKRLDGEAKLMKLEELKKELTK